ncbi:MAG: hypothetical protein K9H49_19270 [Bacteroidales bacterium]|nr:hypothetical protein [Bacteroidales bacterium]MCF8391789.1 hypothetical protein [Bacteroidales bacterium]
MKKSILFIIVLSLFSCEYKLDKEIEKAVKFQLRNYPESTLQDIYKNFFQDAFGPGHLLVNTEESLNYLQIELAEMPGSKLNTKLVPLGYKNNFVRLDLSVIKDGIISYDEYTKAFIDSGTYFKSPDPEDWKEEWHHILKVIEKMNLKLANFDEDKEKLSQMMANGDFAVHHSQAFIDAYDPHYRIIYKEIFDTKLKSYFK